MRTDIQALRGIAVLLVLFQHAGVGPFQGGYLGVDIFFVVSGFVVTNMITDDLRSGRFSFSDFYLRRVKRLLPASYVTFAATAAVAPVFLANAELRDFHDQLVGAVTLTGNFVLWQQSGYFASAADLKPLLHVWSLAIEEQFYLLLPALLMFTPARYRLPLVAASAVGSLIFCAWLMLRDPTAAFYLLPSRLWELGMGSMAALIRPSASNRAGALALPVLAFLAVNPGAGPHPGLSAMMVCLATVAVIRYPVSTLAEGKIGGLLALVGNISYSLYLVHWPVFAFMNSAAANEAWHRLIGVAASFVLALALYFLVERPFRRMEFRRASPVVAAAVAASAVLVVLPAWVRVDPGPSLDSRRPNYGLAEVCTKGGDFHPSSECRTTASPTVLVWGDSYAMHVLPGLEALPGGVEQATRSTCGPILGIAPVSNRHTKAWAERCVSFNDSVFRYLAGSNSIETIVLSSSLFQYLVPGGYNWRTWDGSAVRAVDSGFALTRMRQTIAQLRGIGKRVVVVSPPPSNGEDPSLCAESDCSLSMASVSAYSGAVTAFVENLENYTPVIRLDRELCRTGVCVTRIDGTSLYRDEGHLSYAGSRLLSERMDWKGQVLALAR